MQAVHARIAAETQCFAAGSQAPFGARLTCHSQIKKPAAPLIPLHKPAVLLHTPRAFHPNPPPPPHPTTPHTPFSFLISAIFSASVLLSVISTRNTPLRETCRAKRAPLSPSDLVVAVGFSRTSSARGGSDAAALLLMRTYRGAGAWHRQAAGQQEAATK